MAGHHYLAALDADDYKNWGVSPARKAKLIARNRAIKRLHLQGWTKRAIADSLGLEVGTISAILKALRQANRLKSLPSLPGFGRPVPPPEKVDHLEIPPEMMPERNEAIAYMRNLGVSISIIARLMRLGEDYVRAILKTWQQEHPDEVAGGEKLSAGLRKFWRGE